ncbi:MAG: hypothetical protein PHE02_05140 [Lachnospiraceae bacterium]|nr:hypothetical protein [Lachnospiraceae bacterium]
MKKQRFDECNSMNEAAGEMNGVLREAQGYPANVYLGGKDS